MDRVHEGVHGPGPQWWSMFLEGYMGFIVKPVKASPAAKR